MDQSFPNVCKAENCYHYRVWKIGNAQYFCKKHHYLGNIYTKIELLTFDKVPLVPIIG